MAWARSAPPACLPARRHDGQGELGMPIETLRIPARRRMTQRIAPSRPVPRLALRHDRRSDDSGYGTIGRQGRQEEVGRGEKRGDERDGDGMRRDARRDEKRKEARRGETERGEQGGTARRGRTIVENGGIRKHKQTSKTLPRKAFRGAGRRNMYICADYMDRLICIYR